MFKLISKQLNSIGLLGGSFNPAHEGHIHVSREAKNLLNLDIVIWLVTPQNPLKDSSQTHNYYDRLKSAQTVALPEDYISVSEYEREHGLNYSFDTVSSILKEYPNKKFYWLMGSDCAENFHKWHKWQDLAALIPIIIVNRGHSLEQIKSLQFAKATNYVNMHQNHEIGKGQWTYIDSEIVEISSTKLRGLSSGKNDT